MGKKRKRRRSSENWFQRHWKYLLVGVFVVGSLGIVAAALNPPPVQPSMSKPWTPKPETITAATPQALFIGDSYTAGTGASSKDVRWSTLVSKELGWLEHNEARGGTGYVMTNGLAGCGQDYCPNYPEAIAASTVTPSIVIINGGRNDGETPAGYTDSVRATIDAAKAKWPEAKIVVTSPMWDDDTMPEWMTGTIAAVKDAATATGATYVDLGQPIVGHADYVIADGVHPNDAGYQAIAAAFVAAWPGL